MITVKGYFEKSCILAYVVGFDDIGYDEGVLIYSNPISLYSGVNNPIRIQCLNSDQKRVDVSNVTIQLGLFETNTQNELVINPVTSIDAANGIVQSTLLASQLAPLDFGFYQIGLVATDMGGNAFPIYINDHYGSRLTATLMKGPVFAYADPINVVWTDQSLLGVCSDAINLTGRPLSSTTATLMANLVAYTGNIVAQGSLVSFPTNTDWANISSVYYSNVSGPVFQNVLGSYAWCRFLLPDADPMGTGNVNVNNYITGGNIRL